MQWEVYPHDSSPRHVWACVYGSSRLALRVVAREKRPHEPEVLVLHRPGSKYWGGIGMAQNYAPAEYIVLRCTTDDDHYLYDEIVRFPVSVRAQ